MKAAATILLALAISACASAPNDQLSPAGQSRLTLGIEYMKREQLDRARQQLDKAYADAPHSEAVILALGQWYLRKDKVNSALLLYQRALSWQPMSGALYNNYAIALCLAGNTQQALAMFERAKRRQHAQADVNRRQCLQR